MIVTCLSDLSGRNRIADGRSFIEMVRDAAATVGARHVCVSPNSRRPLSRNRKGVPHVDEDRAMNHRAAPLEEARLCLIKPRETKEVWRTISQSRLRHFPGFSEGWALGACELDGETCDCVSEGATLTMSKHCSCRFASICRPGTTPACSSIACPGRVARRCLWGCAKG